MERSLHALCSICSCTHVVQSTGVLIWFCSSMFIFARVVLVLNLIDLQTWPILDHVQMWPEFPAPSLWPSSMPPLLSPKVKRVAQHLSDRQREAGQGQDWAAIVFVETKVRLTPGTRYLQVRVRWSLRVAHFAHAACPKIGLCNFVYWWCRVVT